MSRRQRRRKERRRERGGQESRLGRSLPTGAGMTVGATLLMGGAAQAATLTVGSTADTTGSTNCAVPTNLDCTLRQAIIDANAAPGSTITFRSGLTGTIGLSAGLPTINNATTISGPGPNQITVDGVNSHPIFDVNTDPGDDVSISGLMITRGVGVPGTGGGIDGDDADIALDHLVITGNRASASGGGISARDGSLSIESSTISGNVAGAEGGGVYAGRGDESPTTVRNSTISLNQADSYGGGLYFDYSSPTILENSTVYGNASGRSGGGIYDFGAYDGAPGLTVTGSTISHNTAPRGGGIACFGATYNGHQLTEPTLRSTIIFGNAADGGENGPDLSCDVGANGGVVPTAFSLIGVVDSQTTISQTAPTILGQDPQLRPLANNGGPTRTLKPAATSPVIDAGSAFGLGVDQRGLGRPFDAPGVTNAAGGDGSDIGAVELQAADVPPAPPVPSPSTPTTPGKKKCKKKHKRSAESAKKKCKKKKKKR